MKDKSYVFFSRDDRTFSLFRKCWVDTIQSLGFPLSFFNRNFGLSRLVYALYFFLKKKGDVRVIFGTSEICLYLIFSKNKDIFVFTGLGRLLQYPGKRRSLIILFLKTFYKGQKIVALNAHDCVFIEGALNTKVNLIHGEGYYFGDFIKVENNYPPIRVAYVGRLLKSKKVDLLINAFIRLEGDFELYLIGDNDFDSADSLNRNWLDKAISRSSGRVKHLGYISSVKDLLSGMDFYVSLSDREGLPFSVLDAIECGCFILLSPVPGHFSFADFDGIKYVNSESELISFFSDISTFKVSNDWSFDRKKRFEKCKMIFGNKKISSEIVKLISQS